MPGEDEDWRISSLDEMPWPQHLFKCRLHDDLAEALEAMENVADGQAATRERSLRLSAAEIATCPYHDPDWRLAADSAVTLLERTGRLSTDDYDLLPEMDEATTWAVWSFVAEPILWSGDDQLRNGQHRVCAMKLAGVARCPHVER